MSLNNYRRGVRQRTYPGDNNITAAHTIARNAGALPIFQRAKTWTGYTAEELPRYHVALTLFTPEAFHYFLPAFMLVSLGSYEKGESCPMPSAFTLDTPRKSRATFPSA